MRVLHATSHKSRKLRAAVYKDYTSQHSRRHSPMPACKRKRLACNPPLTLEPVLPLRIPMRVELVSSPFDHVASSAHISAGGDARAHSRHGPASRTADTVRDTRTGRVTVAGHPRIRGASGARGPGGATRFGSPRGTVVPCARGTRVPRPTTPTGARRQI
ncbi:hypothetical protein EVAR_103531_1 [Eumeta japonica]|uniref:Uncharacterized protein n=1 Tax=Eumeta variegata TaxID=151549 RepID=A0A4C1YXN5_EUMVA|nr:hypothetical protein EVAR_103531_1 [Eumeta japonica]